MKVTVTYNFSQLDLAALAEVTLTTKGRNRKPTEKEIQKFMRYWIRDGMEMQRIYAGAVADSILEKWKEAKI